MSNEENFKPESRMREQSSDVMYDKCVGILLGFKEKLDKRDGWVDMLTVSRAVKEMRQLCKEYKNGDFE